MYHAVAGGRPQLFILHPGIKVLLLTATVRLQSVTVPLTWSQHPSSYLSLIFSTWTGSYLHNETEMCDEKKNRLEIYLLPSFASKRKIHLFLRWTTIQYSAHKLCVNPLQSALKNLSTLKITPWMRVVNAGLLVYACMHACMYVMFSSSYHWLPSLWLRCFTLVCLLCFQWCYFMMWTPEVYYGIYRYSPES